MAVPVDGTQTKKLHTYAVDEIVAGMQQKGYSPSRQGLIGLDLVLVKRQQPDVLIEVKAVRDIRLAEIGEKVSAAAFKLLLAAKTWPKRWGAPLPVVVLASPLMTETVWQFVTKHVAEVVQPVYDMLGLNLAYAAIDHRGLYLSSTDLLEDMPTRPADDRPGPPPEALKVIDIFSGLGQWQLKILLGQRLPEALITVPRGTIRHASDLAKMAGVSKANSYKLVSALREDHFLYEESPLRLGRIPELLMRWTPYGNKTTHEIGVVPILPTGDPEKALDAMLRRLAPLDDGDWSDQRWRTPFRVALAGSAAAERLGAGHVLGVKPLIYLDRVTADTLAALGLRKVSEGTKPAFVIRRPKFPDAVFNAVVNVNGVPVTDALQTWMDAQLTHRGLAPRGQELAQVLMDHILVDFLH